MIKIGNIPLGNRPTIAVTLSGTESASLIRRAKRLRAQLLEIRIDRFRHLSEDEVVKKVRSYHAFRMPLIATLRSPREGGGRSLSEAKRLELFRKVLPSVDAIDLELSSKRLTKTLIPLAHRKRKSVILSYHNFRATPSDRRMTKLVQRGKKAGADFVKIAVTPKTPADVARLLLFTERHREKNLIAIGMGRFGRSTRVLAPLFGSLLTYSFVGRPQAPGQLSLSRISKELKPFL